MEDFSVYYATAQIAVALIGFAALLNYLSRDQEMADVHSGARGDSLLEISVVALLGSLLPEMLFRIGLDIATVWVLSNGLLAAYFYLFLFRLILLVKNTGWGETAFHLLASMALLLGVGIYLTLSALGISWSTPENTFFVGIVISITIAATTFLAQYKLENRGAWNTKNEDTH
jgi:hypothetical protein